MKRLYFLSDIHFGIGSADEERVKQRRFLALAREMEERAERCVIAGDLFDFWFEYRSVLPRGTHHVLHALASLVEHGVRVSYVVGNHDFAAGRFFRDELGIELHHGDAELEAGGTRIAVCHGDGLAPRDGGYRLLKRVIRHPLSIALFRVLHPDAGFALARLVSRQSRGFTAAKDYGASDGMREEARRRIAAGAGLVVMGHRHKPALEAIDGGVYVNLGDWMSHFTYGIFEDGTMTLHTMIRGVPERWEG